MSQPPIRILDATIEQLMGLPDIGKARGRKLFEMIHAKKPHISFDDLSQASGLPPTTWRGLSEVGRIIMPLEDLWDFRQHAQSVVPKSPKSPSPDDADASDIQQVVTDLQQRHQDDLDERERLYAARFEKLREDLETQMERQEEDLLKQLSAAQIARNDLEAAQDALLETHRQSFEREQQDLANKHQQELAVCKDQCDSQLAAMQQTLDGVKQRLCNELRDWRARLDQAEQDKAVLEGQLAQEARFRQGLQQDLDSLKTQHVADLEKAENEKLVLTHELDTLRASRASSQASVVDNVERMFADIMAAVGRPQRMDDPHIPRRVDPPLSPVLSDEVAPSSKPTVLLQTEHLFPRDGRYSRADSTSAFPRDSLPRDAGRRTDQDRPGGHGSLGAGFAGNHTAGGPASMGSAVPTSHQEFQRDARVQDNQGRSSGPGLSDSAFAAGRYGGGCKAHRSGFDLPRGDKGDRPSGFESPRLHREDRSSGSRLPPYETLFNMSSPLDGGRWDPRRDGTGHIPNASHHTGGHDFRGPWIPYDSPDISRHKKSGGGDSSKKSHLFLDPDSDVDSDSSSVSSLEASPKKRRSGPPPPKLATFEGGAGKWKSFYLQFKLAARQYRWDDSTRRRRLLESLRGKAIEYVYSQSSDVRHDYKKLVRTLKQRFGDCEQPITKRRQLLVTRQGEEESLEDFVDRVAALVRDSYPNADEDTLQAMSIEAFFRGCREKQAVVAAVEKSPRTLTAALKLVRTTISNHQAFLGRSYASRSVSFSLPQEDSPAIRTLSSPSREAGEARQLRDLMTEVDRLKRRLDEQDRSRADSQDRSRTPLSPARSLKCFTCNSTGHLNKDCPKKGLSPRTPPSASPSRGNSCFNCQGLGHFARDCPQRRRSPSPQRSTASPSGGSGASNQ